MISFTSFDNIEKPQPSTDYELKVEDFSTFLIAPVAPSHFQPPQKNEVSESPEMMSKVESSESTQIVFENCKNDPPLNTADFSQKTKAGQTSLSNDFSPPQTNEISDPNRSKNPENFFNLQKAALSTHQTIISPPSKAESLFNVQKPALTKSRAIMSTLSTEFLPIPENLPTDQSIYNPKEIPVGIAKDGLNKNVEATVRRNELSVGSLDTEFAKPELSRQKAFSPKPSEIHFFNLKRLPNEEIAGLKFSEKALPEIKPDVLAFAVKSPATKDFKIIPNVEKGDLKTPSTKNPEIKSRAETVETKKTEIGLPQTKATVVTLGGELTETEVVSIKKTPEITEGDFAFNFDKFLTAVTKQSKAIESAVKNPLESQKIFEQVEPRLLQIVSLMTDENEKKVMKMRLHPADLGTIEVRLEKNSAGNLVAHFRTETEAARQSLTQNLEQLRDSLLSSGCQVDQLDVTCQKFSPGNGDQAANHSQRSEPVEYPSAAETNTDRDFTDQKDLKQLQPTRLLSIRA